MIIVNEDIVEILFTVDILSVTANILKSHVIEVMVLFKSVFNILIRYL